MQPASEYTGRIHITLTLEKAFLSCTHRRDVSGKEKGLTIRVAASIYGP